MALRRTTDAATEPVTTAEAKAHLRVTTSTDDTLIDAIVKAARQSVENELQRALITQTWTKTLDQFQDAIELPYPPIIAVSSVRYYDTAGALQTLSPALYSLDNASEPGWLVPAYDEEWPDTQAVANAVEVVYTAGYGAAGLVPQAIKQYLLLMVGHLYENREASIPGVTLASVPFLPGLLDPFRVVKL